MYAAWASASSASVADDIVSSPTCAVMIVASTAVPRAPLTWRVSERSAAAWGTSLLATADRPITTSGMVHTTIPTLLTTIKTITTASGVSTRSIPNAAAETATRASPSVTGARPPDRSVQRPLSGIATALATAAGSSASPVSSALRPRSDCSSSGRNTVRANWATATVATMPSTSRKVGTRNNDISTSG